ncbi:MAG TPA: hypothetical protein VGF28_09655 [Thermoanaerobaculia bacterium]
MSPSVYPAAQVEILDAGPRWSYGLLAANFARVQILVTWYGGDPDRYLAAIEEGLEDAEDRPFLEALKVRLETEHFLLDDMRRIVAEFASRISA